MQSSKISIISGFDSASSPNCTGKESPDPSEIAPIPKNKQAPCSEPIFSYCISFIPFNNLNYSFQPSVGRSCF